MDNTAKERSKQMVSKISQLYKHLSNNKKETVLSEQLLKAAASTGARLAESECALSRGDYLVKVHGALEKCMETRYWLETLNSAGFLTEFEFTTNMQECDAVRAMLYQTVKSIKAALAAPPIKKQ